MLEEQLPCRQHLRSRLLYVFGKAAPLQEVVVSIHRLAVFVLSIAHIGRLFVGLHSVDVVVPIGLAEGAIMKEVIALPHIDHGSLRRNRFHRGMRIDSRHHRQESGVARAHHAHAPIVSLHIRKQPCHRVVSIGALVNSLGIFVIG